MFVTWRNTWKNQILPRSPSLSSSACPNSMPQRMLLAGYPRVRGRIEAYAVAHPRVGATAPSSVLSPHRIVGTRGVDPRSTLRSLGVRTQDGPSGPLAIATSRRRRTHLPTTSDGAGKAPLKCVDGSRSPGALPTDQRVPCVPQVRCQSTPCSNHCAALRRREAERGRTRSRGSCAAPSLSHARKTQFPSESRYSRHAVICASIAASIVSTTS